MNPIAEIFNFLKFLFSVDTKNIENTMYDYLKSEYLTFSWILILLNLLFFWGFYYILKNKSLGIKSYFFTLILIFFINVVISIILFDVMIEPRWQSGYPQLPEGFALVINMAIPFAIILIIVQFVLTILFQIFYNGAIKPFPFLNKILFKKS